MDAFVNLLDKHGIIATEAQKSDFEQWLTKYVWSKYEEERMNYRIIIENRIKTLGLKFPNGTVGKPYKAALSIPGDLADDVWVEGLDQMGLTYAMEREGADTDTVPTDAQIQAADSVSTENVMSPVVPTGGVVFQDIIKTDTSQGVVPGSANAPLHERQEAVTTELRSFILQLSGKPTVPGDFTITLCVKHKGWIDGEPPIVIKLPIAFNPNPRSLWKNIPTSQNLLYYKPDYECEYLKVESDGKTGHKKDIVAASQRGRSHAQEGKPRDDHFKLFHCEESDWYIIAVADGAGSAKYSREGSRIACETVVEHCKEQLLNNTAFEESIRAYHLADNKESARRQMSTIIYKIVGNAAFLASKNITEAALTNHFHVKDFATTLMFAICKKFDFGWFVASYWVGDGAMCIFNKENKSYRLLGVPDEGEYSGQTRFLTMQEIFKDPKSVLDRLRFSIEEDFTALILMTDGVSDPMFGTINNLNTYQKWEELWDKLITGFAEDDIRGVNLTDDNEEAKYQLLKWMDFWSPGNHDDRTMAILY